MSVVELSRHVAADPASVALLLAEPPSRHATLPQFAVAPPRRTGVGFVADVTIVDGTGTRLAGEVTVRPSAEAGCDVRLVTSAADPASAHDARRVGASFLDELAARAHSRSYAA